jgi:hypothetical protein
MFHERWGTLLTISPIIITSERINGVTGLNFEINYLVTNLVNRNASRGLEVLRLQYTESTYPPPSQKKLQNGV